MPRSSTDTAEQPPAPKCHNGPSHDDIRMAANQMVALRAEREAVNTKISKFRKGLKAQGFTLGVLDAVITMLEWSPEEIKAHFAERDWYAEALRYPVGTQLEFFGTDATPDLVREQLKWRNVGFKNGLVGKGWPDESPDGCPPECDQSYGEGWEEGAGTTRRAFLEKQKALGPIVPEGTGDGESDEDDDTEHQQVQADADNDADEAPEVDGETQTALDDVEAEAEAQLGDAA